MEKGKTRKNFINISLFFFFFEIMLNFEVIPKLLKLKIDLLIHCNFGVLYRNAKMKYL